MLYIIIALIIIIGILGYKLFQKQKIDKEEYQLYQDQLKQVKQDVKDVWVEFHLASDNLQQIQNTLNHVQEKTEYEKCKLEECKKDLQAALDVYQDITDNKLKEIETSMEEQRQKRQEELEQALADKQAYYNKILEDTIAQCSQQDELIKETSAAVFQEATEKIKEYNDAIAQAKERFESIERTLRQYSAEQQAKLFYTIQLPEEYKEDIDFLLITVAAKVQHPDIISKLVWQEYVKPNLDDTFKRIEIRSEPGIYKLTSLQNGKCYIGKSTNVKNRIADHFKSVVGIKSIADQAVHHAILKEGFWNWQIEIITYCDKDRLNELEKYYIEFFKAQEFGYNKTSGG